MSEWEDVGKQYFGVAVQGRVRRVLALHVKKLWSKVTPLGIRLLLQGITECTTFRSMRWKEEALLNHTSREDNSNHLKKKGEKDPNEYHPTQRWQGRRWRPCRWTFCSFLRKTGWDNSSENFFDYQNQVIWRKPLRLNIEFDRFSTKPLTAWLHRRSEEPLWTSVESYWKKSRLS